MTSSKILNMPCLKHHSPSVLPPSHGFMQSLFVLFHPVKFGLAYSFGNLLSLGR